MEYLTNLIAYVAGSIIATTLIFMIKWKITVLAPAVLVIAFEFLAPQMMCAGSDYCLPRFVYSMSAAFIIFMACSFMKTKVK